jgi:hypothetical protein
LNDAHNLPWHLFLCPMLSFEGWIFEMDMYSQDMPDKKRVGGAA